MRLGPCRLNAAPSDLSPKQDHYVPKITGIYFTSENTDFFLRDQNAPEKSYTHFLRRARGFQNKIRRADGVLRIVLVKHIGTMKSGRSCAVDC